MTDLVSGAIGSEGKYDVSFVGGNLVAMVGDSKYGAQVQISISAKAVLEALKGLLPAGSTVAQIGDALIAMVEAALPAVEAVPAVVAPAAV